MSCRHPLDSIFWYNKYGEKKAINEDGWWCIACGKNLGFRPDLDRKLIWGKVRAILHDLHEEGFIYISNGTEGDCITDCVAEYCEKTQQYDSYTILKQIILCLVDVHAKYWKNEAKKWLKEHKKVKQ